MPIKVLILIKRKAGTTAQEFQQYYEAHHAPLAMQIVGARFLKYVRNFVTTGDEMGFDVVTEIWFKDQEQYEGFQADLEKEREGQDRITKDEDSFVDRGALRFFCGGGEGVCGRIMRCWYLYAEKQQCRKEQGGWSNKIPPPEVLVDTPPCGASI